jgi:hypothetical protein
MAANRRVEMGAFRREGGEDAGWFLPESEIGCEVHVADRDGRPDEEAVALAQRVVDRLDELEERSLEYLRAHLAFTREAYEFSHIVEVLPGPDRYGVRVLLPFYNDDDGYLSIEAGFRPDDIREPRSRVHYALMIYH